MTQNDEVLKYLKSGRSLSARVASRQLAIDRLSARIYDLRGDGVNIVSMPQKRRSKRTGRMVRYCIYFMPEARQ